MKNGTIKYCEEFQTWQIDCEPHIALRMKRVFPKLNQKERGTLSLDATAENSYELKWFLQRYPMPVEGKRRLTTLAKRYVEKQQRLEDILGGSYEPRAFDLALPLREYQVQAVELFLTQGFLLVGDDVGLGKTVEAIAAFTEPRTLPALVVTLTHLPRQWELEIHRFMPSLQVHIIKKGTPYNLPQFFGRGPDVLIINYHKLAGWQDHLLKYVKSVVFDEIQELRRSESQKYQAAGRIAEICDYKIGLSATPVYNYGGEFWNICDVLAPGVLGGQGEFQREWCSWGGDKIQDPKAFGTYVREKHIMLRRTRKDVGRELPAVSKVYHIVDVDSKALDEIQSSALELAKIILKRSKESYKGESYHAAGKFDMIMRQATGIAKAPHVADFVRMLVDSGEKVVVYGWHRQVYKVWQEKLKDIEVVWYTGSESVVAKQKAKDAFIDGGAQVLAMSLRSGLGLDGLQYVCRTVVFGELDWSPGVHEQCLGRIYRDGQPEPVMAYYLVAEDADSVDPIMAQVLGLKREQVQGIKDPDHALVEKLQRDTGNVRRLAENYVRRHAPLAAARTG